MGAQSCWHEEPQKRPKFALVVKSLEKIRADAQVMEELDKVMREASRNQGCGSCTIA